MTATGAEEAGAGGGVLASGAAGADADVQPATASTDMRLAAPASHPRRRACGVRRPARSAPGLAPSSLLP